VFEDAVVDFVFVAIIDVVEQVKMLLFISNVGMFFHSSAPPDSASCTGTQKQTKLPRRNSLTTKERQKSEKNNAIYIASSV
jgi:hypothetical protein